MYYKIGFAKEQDNHIFPADFSNFLGNSSKGNYDYDGNYSKI